MEISVKNFSELKPDELYGILQLRECVFTFEQHCSEPDIDGFDKIAYHVFVTDEDGLEACLRMLPKGTLHEEVSFGRIVSAKRRQGFGAAVVKAATKAAKERLNASAVEISAQTHARKFYEEMGFTACGDTYEEAGIEHIKMVCKIND